jgi:aspartate aminotransferase
LKFAYGDACTALADGRVAAMQTLSGTGSLRVVTEYLKRFHGSGALYVPNPTWGNHIPIAEHAGLTVNKYAYFDPETVGLNFAGMLDDVNAAPDGSVFLLHACAHNPTGIDPNNEQWAELSALMKQKRHFPLFDSAYQGFASGDANIDASSVRMFVKDGHSIALCQSFAKNFGLYGQRIGALSFVCVDHDETARVLSQLKVIARAMYSNPPSHGARIVEAVLADDALRLQWEGECKEMADRIQRMRGLLTKHLVEDLRSSLSWDHISDQIGMFCFSGLTAEQVGQMVHEHHIYLTSNGRISMAGVTSENVEYIAESIHAVTR